MWTRDCSGPLGHTATLSCSYSSYLPAEGLPPHSLYMNTHYTLRPLSLVFVLFLVISLSAFHRAIMVYAHSTSFPFRHLADLSLTYLCCPTPLSKAADNGLWRSLKISSQSSTLSTSTNSPLLPFLTQPFPCPPVFFLLSILTASFCFPPSPQILVFQGPALALYSSYPHLEPFSQLNPFIRMPQSSSISNGSHLSGWSTGTQIWTYLNQNLSWLPLMRQTLTDLTLPASAFTGDSSRPFQFLPLPSKVTQLPSLTSPSTSSSN